MNHPDRLRSRRATRGTTAMRALRPVGLPAIIVVILSACGAAGDGGAAVTVDTLVSGVIVVTSPETGVWGESEAWTLVEDLRIGAMDGDGPDVFGRIAGLAVDPEGRIYVLDQQAAEVRIFSPEGVHLRTLGRRGGGPGEFRNPSGLALAPDGSIWVTDPGNGRYSVFDRDGGVRQAHGRPFSFFMMPWPGGFDDRGRLHDAGSVMAADAGSSRLVLVRFDQAVQPSDTAWLPDYQPRRVRVMNAAGLPMMDVVVPYSPRMQWRFDRRGYVWSGISETYELVQSGLSGDTVRIVRRGHVPEPVTAAEADSARMTLRGVIENAGAGARVEEEARVPSRKPAFEDFFVDSEGFLWVVRPRSGGGGVELDIFDSDGRYLGAVDAVIPLTGGYALPVLSGEAVHAVHVDDLGVPHVVRLRIEGRR